MQYTVSQRAAPSWSATPRSVLAAQEGLGWVGVGVALLALLAWVVQRTWRWGVGARRRAQGGRWVKDRSLGGKLVRSRAHSDGCAASMGLCVSGGCCGETCLGARSGVVVEGRSSRHPHANGSQDHLQRSVVCLSAAVRAPGVGLVVVTALLRGT